MRIVLVSTFDQKGGAALAALRLMRGLRQLGHECSLLVKEKTSTDASVRQLRLDNSRNARLQQRAAEQIQKYCINRNRTPLSNTFFSLGSPGYDLSGDREVLAADVVHLHWVSNLLSPTAVARLQQLGKPVLWTLHDQRAFTGGCHYSAGCRQYESMCEGCPQLQDRSVRLTETILREATQSLGGNLTIICPSRWMSEHARASAVLKQHRIETIPYGIDTSVFNPHRAKAQKRSGLESGRLRLLIGADVGSEKRKGFHLLGEALRQVFECASAQTRTRIELLIFGGPPPEAYNDLPWKPLGRITSERELADLYAGADAFLLPSLEDNLPNTMLEAVCSGTPVIGFATGGIPDVVDHGKTGLLAATGDTHALARVIQQFLEDGGLRASLAAACETLCPPRFALQLQAERHVSLYRALIRSRHGGVQPTGGEVHPLAPLGPAMSPAFPKLLRYSRRQKWRRRFRSLLPFQADPSASYS